MQSLATSTSPETADNYHFDRFQIGTARQDMVFSAETASAGGFLPDATLLNLAGEEISLRALAGQWTGRLLPPPTETLISYKS